MTPDEKADAELDLFESLFETWLLEHGFAADPQPLNILRRQAYIAGCLEGFERGANVALIKSRQSFQQVVDSLTKGE